MHKGTQRERREQIVKKDRDYRYLKERVPSRREGVMTPYRVGDEGTSRGEKEKEQTKKETEAIEV